jgi:hypothetical protein
MKVEGYKKLYILGRLINKKMKNFIHYSYFSQPKDTSIEQSNFKPRFTENFGKFTFFPHR